MSSNRFFTFYFPANLYVLKYSLILSKDNLPYYLCYTFHVGCDRRSLDIIEIR